MKSSIFSLVVAAVLLIGETASADLIIINTVSSQGSANVVSGRDFDSWSGSALGSYSASASYTDPGTPSQGTHTASASAILSYSANEMAISTSASASLGYTIGSSQVTRARTSPNSISFTLLETADVTFSGSPFSSEYSTRLDNNSGELEMVQGQTKTLDPGNYTFYANLDYIGGGQMGSYFGGGFSVLTFSTAVPEPSSAMLFGFGALFVGLRRRR